MRSSVSLMLLMITAVPSAVRAVEPMVHAWLQHPVVSDPELDQLRGGIRVGRFDVNIGLAVRDSLDGREVLSSRLSFARDRIEIEAAPTAAASAQSSDTPGQVRTVRLASSQDAFVIAAEARDAMDEATTFRQELTPEGVRLLITNEASDVSITRDATLFIDVSNFESVLGSTQVRAARELSKSLRSSTLR